MPRVPEAVRMFAPERWGEVERFRALWTTSHRFRGHEKRVLAGVENHFHKATTLLDMAEGLVPSLDLDEAELEERGFTPARNARNLAAVLEAAITEIYSVVDCTVKVLHVVYGPTSARFRDSTRRLFAEVDAISGSLPEPIKDEVRAAAWFDELRDLRDELTHRDTGSCSRDRETGLVSYFHSGLWDGERLKPIDDVLGWIRDKINAVNVFIGTAFHELNATIVGGTVTQMCGMVEGRMLMRLLDASQPIDFDNGACLSAQWFTQPGNPRCPFADDCGAFHRLATAEQLRSVFGEAT